ncbi:PadR family transcriptional regulator [Cellulomonas sp. KRMCY2]|uniref:PadR family transcriptional regulator n=1 Tax=Cellulomonas sp. KRMCY2 TaxID=1304865 RepID=UPI0004A363DA|nr:PadR family transcriptional regulator [Cellulomonas sp. KRMCY2]
MTDDVRDPQLLKGVLPMLVLHLLTERESYGYELVTRLQAAGLTDIAAGTVYPLLTRLEREASISSRLVASTSGPARKYYCPTPDGAAALAAAVRGWEQLARTVAGVLDTASPAAQHPAAALPHGQDHSPAGTTSTPEEHR